MGVLGGARTTVEYSVSTVKSPAAKARAARAQPLTTQKAFNARPSEKLHVSTAQYPVLVLDSAMPYNPYPDVPHTAHRIPRMRSRALQRPVNSNRRTAHHRPKRVVGGVSE